MTQTPTQVMESDNRTYLTPEDVTDSLKSGCPREEVWKHVLQHLSQKNCEDWSLCAFNAIDESPDLDDDLEDDDEEGG